MTTRYALLGLVAISLSRPSLYAQTILFTEDFEGPTPAFSLNTTDVQSTATGDNTWLINNVYAGGSGTITCFGFPLPFTVPATAAQPAGVSSANGNYLHTVSVAAFTSGVLNCCFVAADGLCSAAGNYFARMSTDVSTVGSGAISLSFWWLCGGGTNNYGEVYYSTDQGSTWTLITEAPNQYRNQSAWAQQTITLPTFQDQPDLRFGFRFFNGVTASAQDPGFGIDDVMITAAQAVPNTIATGLVSPIEVCAGGTIAVEYTVQGPYSPGNIFTAELSDGTGSFATPVAIGTLASTIAGTISGTIPPGTPAGAGYRIRVVSSAPVIVGTVNAVDITVGDAPFAGIDDAISLCKNSGSYDLFTFLGIGISTCGSWVGPENQPMSGMIDTDTDNAGPYTYITDCPGGCPQDQAVITVTLVNPANAGLDVNTSLCSNAPPADLSVVVSGGDVTGFFFQQGVPFQSSQLGTSGSYALEYVVYANTPCVNDTAEIDITVNDPPDAGTSTTATFCVNAPAVDLITLLVGADPGGTWMGPSGQPFTGMLDPAAALAGLYTYAVSGIPPCEDEQSFVAVVIDPCTGIGEHTERNALRWLGQDAAGMHVVEVKGFEPVGYRVFNATGQLVVDRGIQRTGDRFFIDMHGQTSGAYVVLVMGDQGAVRLRLVHAR